MKLANLTLNLKNRFYIFALKIVFLLLFIDDYWEGTERGWAIALCNITEKKKDRSIFSKI